MIPLKTDKQGVLKTRSEVAWFLSVGSAVGNVAVITSRAEIPANLMNTQLCWQPRLSQTQDVERKAADYFLDVHSLTIYSWSDGYVYAVYTNDECDIQYTGCIYVKKPSQNDILASMDTSQVTP